MCYSHGDNVSERQEEIATWQGLIIWGCRISILTILFLFYYSVGFYGENIMKMAQTCRCNRKPYENIQDLLCNCKNYVMSRDQWAEKWQINIDKRVMCFRKKQQTSCIQVLWVNCECWGKWYPHHCAHVGTVSPHCVLSVACMGQNRK